MRITPNGLPDLSSSAPVQETSRVEAPSPPAARPAAPPSAEPLQSAALTPALEALGELPEIDQAKVAAARDALAKGEIQFDAGKLAGLIARYHGGRG